MKLNLLLLVDILLVLLELENAVVIELLDVSCEELSSPLAHDVNSLLELH